MAAATADREGHDVHGKILDEATIPVAAAAVIFAFTMVSTNASGYLVAAADVVGQVGRAIWVSLQGVDNSGGVDGEVSVRVMVRGNAVMETNGLTRAQTMGLVVDATNDQDLILGGTSVNTRPVGRVTAWSSTRTQVQIG